MKKKKIKFILRKYKSVSNYLDFFKKIQLALKYLKNIELKQLDKHEISKEILD